MIYITGDCHGDFKKFSTKYFSEQKKMTKDDFVIVCGDFGGVWSYGCSDATEKYWLDWLEEKPFTLLFVDGNHENFDRLYHDFPVVKFHGGKAHKIRDNVYHLMRGYVFDLQGKKFFAFGGASSHDIDDGILQPKDFKTLNDMYKQWHYNTFKLGKIQRMNHVSWWSKELPLAYEMKRGIRELEKVNYEVDYVISHCAPQDIASMMSHGNYKPDKLTMYFSEIARNLKFKKWYFGHYHRNDSFMSKFILLYYDIERIL